MTGAAHLASGGHEAGAPVAEGVTIRRSRDGGSVVRTSGMTMSEAREACVVTIRIMGVA